jgi:hypothetical protein
MWLSSPPSPGSFIASIGLQHSLMAPCNRFRNLMSQVLHGLRLYCWLSDWMTSWIMFSVFVFVYAVVVLFVCLMCDLCYACPSMLFWLHIVHTTMDSSVVYVFPIHTHTAIRYIWNLETGSVSIQCCVLFPIHTHTAIRYIWNLETRSMSIQCCVFIPYPHAHGY